MSGVTAQPPFIRKFLCINPSNSTTIYPAIFDTNGTKIWSGKDSDKGKYEILPGGTLTVDITTVDTPPKDGSPIALGCYIKDDAHPDTSKMDLKTTKTFSSSSPNTATGTFIGEGIDGVFTVNPIDTSSETLTAVEAKSLLVQANVLATVNFLRSVADLISVGA